MQAGPEHVAFMEDLKAALAKHTNLSGVEMLAVASQFVGNLVALQDQTRYSASRVMEIVANNIEIGNAVAIEAALGSPQGRA